MTLYEFTEPINDGTPIHLFAECTGTRIAEFDGKDDIEDYYMDEEITDVFTDFSYNVKTGKGTAVLCIEIAIEPDMDYDE